MARKKTTYEKKGLVRQLAGSLFPPGQKDKTDDSVWRPRKTLFEKLDGADDEEDLELDGFTNSVFSVECYATDYHFGNLVEQKKTTSERSRNTQKQQQKRDLSSIIIKPSSKDKFNPRTTSMRTRETSNENASFVKDPFSPYNVDNVDGHRVPRTAGQVSFENSSKNTTKAQNASINVINSDPIDFFNQQPLKLTKKNLDMVAPTPSEADRAFGIENVNPRSEFLQFTTDEDKESTVIESVRFPGEDQYGTESKDEDEDLLDDDDPYGIAYIDKGTVVPAVGVKTPSNRTNETMTKLNEAVFPAFTFMDGNQLKTDPFFSEAGPFEPKESDRDSGILSAQQFQSTHSLAYSASSCGETNNLQKSENLHRFMNKLEDHRGQNRFPLSPRNVFSNSKLPERGMSKINTKADPDVKWADFSDCAFEKKPDRKGGE
jgi:hypothetical protein